MSISTVIEQAAQEYEPRALQAAAKRIYCWRLRRYIKVMSADMGQKPRILPDTNAALAPEFTRKMRISGLRREIVELLQESGPMRLDAIAHVLEVNMASVASQLGRQPEFYTDGRSKNSIWYLDDAWLQSAIDADMAIIEKTPRETIADYITEHGPSTVSAITDALGRDPRPTLQEHFVVVEQERPAVWSLTDNGKTIELAYRSVAAKAIDAIREHGPMSVDDIAAAIERKKVSSIMHKYKEYFVRTQPHRYALWGFK